MKGMKDMNRGEPCKLTREQESAGRHEAAVVCGDPSGHKVTFTSSTSYTATTYERTYTFEVIGHPENAIKITRVVSARRIGECKS